MKQSDKEWIDNATYQQLLSKWRFAKSGDPLLQGETGDYFAERMKILRAEIGDAEHTAISKEIGW